MDVDGDPYSLDLELVGVEALKCTHFPACLGVLPSSYGALVSVPDSPWLKSIREVVAKVRDATDLKHLAISFDDGPCYEAICQSFSARKSEA